MKGVDVLLYLQGPLMLELGVLPDVASATSVRFLSLSYRMQQGFLLVRSTGIYIASELRETRALNLWQAKYLVALYAHA